MTGRTFARFSATTVSVTLTVCAALRAQQPPPAPPQQNDAPIPGQTAGQRYKNVQILKDIPAEQLQLTMQYIAASLGVQCNFCHVQGRNESDDKETKKTARQMMKMVSVINETQFEGRSVLSCASCHNGRNKPQRTSPLATEMTPADAARARAAAAARGRGGFPPGGGPQGPPAGGPGSARGAPAGGPGAEPGGRGRGGREGAPEAQQPPEKPTETVDQVVAKYIQALGGRPALESATTRVMTGTVTMRDLQSAPVTVQEKSTGEYRIEIASQPNPTIRAFNGRTGWTVGGFNNQVRDLDAFQLQQATRLADLSVPLHLNERYNGLAVTRYADVDGKATIVLTGRPHADVTEQLFFERDSGLLLRRTVATRTGLGELAEQIDYSDYRDVGAIKMPFTVRHATWNSVTAAKYTDVKLNVPVADDQFSKPTARE